MCRARDKQDLRGIEGKTLKCHPIGERIGLVRAGLFRRDHELKAARPERGEASELSRAVGHDEAPRAIEPFQDRWNVRPRFEFAPPPEELAGALGVQSDLARALTNDVLERPVALSA